MILVKVALLLIRNLESSWVQVYSLSVYQLNYQLDKRIFKKFMFCTTTLNWKLKVNWFDNSNGLKEKEAFIWF